MLKVENNFFQKLILPLYAGIVNTYVHSQESKCMKSRFMRITWGTLYSNDGKPEIRDFLTRMRAGGLTGEKSSPDFNVQGPRLLFF
jgi:hypothetical protein